MLQVFDFDRFGKHDKIGEIMIPMNTIDLGQPIHEWKDLSGGEKEEVHMFIRSVYLMIITVLTILLYVVFFTTARKAGRCLYFPSLRPHGREADGQHHGSQKPEEDGCGRTVR